MKCSGCVVALGCVLLFGCREATAPAQPLSGAWDDVLSVAGQAGPWWARCSGVLHLTLNQADTVLSGTYASPPDFLCDMLAGPPIGFPRSPAVSGVANAAGCLRLMVPMYPDPLAMVGCSDGERVSGQATWSLSFQDSSGATVTIPLAGAFELVRSP
jgi:hypothetical protein